MRRMYSENQIKGIVQNSSSEVVEALKGQDINVEGITSKGIANTGGLANIGNVAISGELSASGDVKVFENIVDKNGHKRFQESDITIETIEGITQVYGKWSLSGSHLLIVIAIDLDANISLSASDIIAKIQIPEWIGLKIVPLFSVFVSPVSFDAWSNGGSKSNIDIFLKKNTSTELQAIMGSNFTASSVRHVRIAYDLLIDNEDEE